MPQIDNLFTDEEIRRYLYAAHTLESAGNSIVEALREGKTAEDVKRAVEGIVFSEFTPQELAFGVAFGQLLIPGREEMIVDYESLRYFGVPNDMESVKETLSASLNRDG